MKSTTNIRYISGERLIPELPLSVRKLGARGILVLKYRSDDKTNNHR